jgi:hypothetical protein
MRPQVKRIRKQHFVTEDPVELVTSTQHKVSLKKVMEWMEHAGGVSPKEIAMKARVREGRSDPAQGSADGVRCGNEPAGRMHAHRSRVAGTTRDDPGFRSPRSTRNHAVAGRLRISLRGDL